MTHKIFKAFLYVILALLVLFIYVIFLMPTVLLEGVEDPFPMVEQFTKLASPETKKAILLGVIKPILTYLGFIYYSA
jgi:hypothetical protein